MVEQSIRGGDPEERLLACGQGVELVEDIPTCKELIERIVKEGEGALEERSLLKA